MYFTRYGNVERKGDYMINSYVCTGRLVADPEVKETDNGKKYSNITLAVPRTYKNADGEYETDFLDYTLWGDIASNTAEYCKKGDVIGIKGRMASKLIDTEEGKKIKKTEVVVEKISFLAVGKQKDAEPEMEWD